MPLHEQLTRAVIAATPKRVLATGEDCVYTWDLRDVSHALTILARLDEGLDSGVEVRGSALYVDGPLPDQMDPDDVSRLVRLGFHYDDVTARWVRRS